jgi:solute carrier family 7 (L-type amino acid transporter), member 6
MAHTPGGYEAVPSDDNPGRTAAEDSVEAVDVEMLPNGEVEGGADTRADNKHRLTFTNGLALVLGLQIGSGIFAAPSQVSQHTASAAVALSVWVAAGLLVWTGAATFVELGLAIPRNGGIQEYLRAGYGDYSAFLFAWGWTIVVKPCAMALIAIVFAENLCRGLAPEALSDRFVVKLVAVVGLATVLFVNCRGVRTGATVGNLFLLLKLFTMVSIPCLGVVSIWTVKHDLPTKTSPGPEIDNPWSFIGEYTTALFGALFCYGGWETVCRLQSLDYKPFLNLCRQILLLVT